ncbi:MAG: hypothetical protein QF659_07740 [Dehalococcoidia bacterium]|nr:hypothetical protein [Dehalococcoidia bacterium]
MPQAALVVLVILSALGQSIVAANGRAAAVSSQESGPYRIKVGILPGRAVVGKNHLSVRLWSLASGETLTSATVEVSAAGPEGSTKLGPAAAVSGLSPAFFETDLAFDVVGPWEVTVAVSSNLGETAILVPLEVRESGGGINLILMAAVVVMILAASVFVWGQLPGRTRRTKNGA